MKTWLALLTVILTASGAGAQSIPASQSRVAGRFVAYNYGLWNTYPASISPATGSQTFTVLNSYVNLGDGRLISPYSTNASLRVGTETVTPTAVSTCYVNDVRIGVCQITATFTRSHTNSDKISSATFGLQEALNDAGNSGGGVVTVDSAWAGVGGTTAIVNAATIPANTSIEDVRTGGGGGGSGTVSGQASGTIPLATASTVIGAQSHLDDGVTTPGTVTATEPVAAPSVTLGSDLPAGHQAASANAAVVATSPLAYGAVADWRRVTSCTTAVSTTLTCPSSTFTSADVGKWVLEFAAACPFATTPCTAQIAGFIDTANVTLSRPNTSAVSVTIDEGTDNVPAFNTALAAARVVHGKVVPPAGSYFLATATYPLITGARDPGTYGTTTGGGSGGTITCSISSGQVTSCSVSGGSNYTANNILQTSVSGGCGAFTYNDGPCGYALITVTTDSTGVPNAVQVRDPGFGLVSPPTVTIIPSTGDGAAATATVSGGAINSTNVTAGGSGYPLSGTVDWYGIGGTGCVEIAAKNWGVGHTPVSAYGTAPTDSTGHVINTLTVTNAGSGCSVAPIIVFGDYACGASFDSQCTNIAPLEPITMPTQIIIPSGVSIEGQANANFGGVSLYGNWDKVSVDNNESLMFGQHFIKGSTISGLYMEDYFVGIEVGTQDGGINYGTINQATITDIRFGPGGQGMMTFGVDRGGIVENIRFEGYGSWVNGGWWNDRRDTSSSNGGFDNSWVENNLQVQLTPYNATAAALDNWFNDNFWHQEYSTNTDFYETCKFPQTPAQRQAGRSMLSPFTANGLCYRGVTGWGFADIHRANGGSNFHTVNNILAKGLGRGIYYGDTQGGLISNMTCCEGSTLITSDPYHTGTLEGGVIFMTSSSTAASPLNNITYSNNGSILQCAYQLFFPAGGGAAVLGQITGNAVGLACVGETAAPATEAYDLYQKPNLSNGGNAPIGLLGGVLIGNAATTGGEVVALSGGMRFKDPTFAINLMDLTTAGETTYVPINTPSLCLNGGTCLTSQSSAQAQVVTCAAGGTTTQYCGADGNWHAAAAGSIATGVPAWLTNLGDGSDGAITATGAVVGEVYATSWTLPFGNTVTCNQVGFTVHATGTCTIAGTITCNAVLTATSVQGGGPSGGSGGGAAGGAAGAGQISLYPSTNPFTMAAGGTAGASSGGNGGNATALTTSYKREIVNGVAAATDGLFLNGGPGRVGGNNSTAQAGGAGVTLICNSITGTDGSHTGTIDASGLAGSPSTANSVGANSGPGGGVVILSSHTAIATPPNVYVAGGPGGLVTVPEAVGASGTCTSPPKATLGVTAGALNGTCTVVQAGTGCGTGGGVIWNILGGGGTVGTATVNPTWSGGALASCTVTAGTSSGYTASTFTTAGTGGDGRPGVTATFTW